MIDNEKYELRKKAFTYAKSHMIGLCKEYPPETITDKIGSYGPLTAPTTSTTSPSEQFINLTITIADWLIHEGD